jgi:hypothetical protein
VEVIVGVWVTVAVVLSVAAFAMSYRAMWKASVNDHAVKLVVRAIRGEMAASTSVESAAADLVQLDRKRRLG